MDGADRADGTLADALRQCSADKFSGVLRVDGQPGGAIHLTDGRICACETSGAPSLEVILLRSRRVSESGWDTAFTAAAVGQRQLTAELVARDLLGAGELEALLRAALADAIFALVSGRVDGWTEGAADDCLLPLTPAARPGWLLAEATRRRQVLAAFPGPSLSARDRVAAVPETARATRVPGQDHDEILALADGRRTVRDLAFARGRGLYETMLQLARMRANYLVVIRPYGDEETRTATGLPRRHKDRPASPRTAAPSRRTFIPGVRMLRPRAEGNENSPELNNPLKINGSAVAKS
jgi:hypothetical protein